MSVTNEIRKLVEEELKNANKQEELYEFDLNKELNTIARTAGLGGKFFSSGNFAKQCCLCGLIAFTKVALKLLQR